MHATGTLTEDELLTLVAAAETDSEHPLSTAIVAGARDRGLTASTATRFDSITGKGVQATVDGHTVLVGNARLLTDAGIDTSGLDPISDRLAGEGKTPILAAVNGRPAGVLAVADTIKADSAAAVTALRRLGVEVVMLTGDNARTATAIARQVGVSRVLAEVLPEHNTGTDVAIEAADITLISGSLAGVVTAIRLSRATMRTSGRTCSSR